MTEAAGEPHGTLAVALAHAARLLETNPVMAEAQAMEILKVAPEHPQASLLLGAARRRRGDGAGALAALHTLVARQPHWGDAQIETGLTLASLGRHDEAVRALRRAVEFSPDASAAWRALGDQLTILDDAAAADAAYAQAIRASVRDPRLMEAAAALCDGRLAIAEALLRTHLKAHPTDVAAMRMLAEVGARLGRFEDAENLLTRCLELAPSFTAARHNYALILHRQSKAAAALAQVDRLLELDPSNPSYRFLKAAVLARTGEYDAAIEIYQAILAVHPDNHRAWLSLGHACKTAGRQADSVKAYCRSAELAPNFGEAYWSLANMKTYRFDDADMALMQAQIARPELADEDRFHFHYALGKAFEDGGAYAQSFAHYAEGARLRRAGLGYDSEETSEHMRRSVALFSKAFLAQRAGQGAPAPDPIFIVGLPRAGSTLLEQILASHSAVEGTSELPDIAMIAKTIGGGKTRGLRYPEALAEMSPDRLAALGKEYIARTRAHRKTAKPFFIDKMPNNFQHVGLIQLILPNAKIIDARRHPMASCFSAFKQHFARGQGFSYDLTELGRYYADYVALMDHYDHATPGRVHRVFYEDVVADTESEIRRLLAYCGLNYEPECLHFHANSRAVRTASSEQVRQPIYTDALAQWRQYEAWLGPLQDALGPVLEAYPKAPFDSG